MRIYTLAVLSLLSLPLDAQTPVKLKVDATDAPRRLFHVQMTMPAKPGPMTLLYPEWIPGEHGPTGPIVNLVGLKIEGGGKTIPWKRDSVNMYAFHLDVPAGATSLDVAFDFISPPETGGFHLRRLRHHRTGRAQLESVAALSRRAPSPTSCNTRPPCASPTPGATAPPCPSPANPATRSNSSRRRSPP